MFNPESATPFLLASVDLESFVASAEGTGYNPAGTQHMRLAGIGSWLRYLVACLKNFESDSPSTMSTKTQMLNHLKSLREDVWGGKRLKKLEKNSSQNSTIIHHLEEKAYHREASRVISFKNMVIEYKKSAHYIGLQKKVTSCEGRAVQLAENSRAIAGMVYVHSSKRPVAVCSLKVGDWSSRNYLFLPKALAHPDSEARETDYISCPLASNGHPLNTPNKDTHRYYQ